MDTGAAGGRHRGAAQRWAAAALAVVLLGAAAVAAWVHFRQPVAPADIAAFLGSTTGDRALRFAGIEAAVTRRTTGPEGTTLEIKVEATARATSALYARTDPADYLRDRLKVSEASFPRRGAARPGDDPFAATIIRQVTAADEPFAYDGFIVARRGDSGWRLSLLSGGFVGTGPQGSPRAAFGPDALVAGEPATDARLTTELAGLAAAEAADNEEHAAAAAEADDRDAAARQAFTEAVAAGSILEGAAREEGSLMAQKLSLEILSSSDAGDVTALLRNDESWVDARTFQGTWSARAGSSPVLSLSSQPEQAVPGAGPIIEITQPWAITLEMDGHGVLAGADGRYSYRFHALGKGQAEALRRRLGAELSAARAATRPGMAYIGSAAAASGGSEAVILRFGQAQGLGISAVLESPGHPWRRQFRGTLLVNSRRSGGMPVRLASADTDAARDAPTASALGDQEELDLRLATSEGGLAGQDDYYSYKLAPITESDTRRLASEAARRTGDFLRVVRPGMVLDGFLREDQGFIGHAEMTFTEVDRASGSVSAVVRSLSRPGAFQRFSGTIDPSESALVLNGTGHGNFPSDDAFDIPFLRTPGAVSVHLVVAGGAISGVVEGDPHWKIEFPLAAFLAAPTEAADARGDEAYEAVFPRFPEKKGAYVLAGREWKPLPENGGHVVIETVKPDSDLRMPVNLESALEGIQGAFERRKKSQKVPFLEFDGKEPRPEVGGPAIVLLYVGSKLEGKPPMELGQADVTKSGQRRLPVLHGPEGKLEYGNDRLPAFVRTAGQGRMLLTTTAMPSPGPYVLIAGTGYELVQD
ncbi:MAG TPA: hypothetical protein VGG34_11340 [Opitutaceae bacterium]|jgi:hypothetical protein